MRRLTGILVLSLLSGCGTVTVVLGTTLSGAEASGEAKENGGGGATGSSGTAGSSTGAVGGGSSGGGSGGGSPPMPTTCMPNGDTFDNYAKAALADNCTSGGCHRGRFDTLAHAKNNADTIRSYISTGTMPPGGTLDASDKSRLMNWVLCNTP